MPGAKNLKNILEVCYGTHYWNCNRAYDAESKATFWTEVDAWLTDALYLHPNFKAFFDKRAGTRTDGLWPTVTIRQIMWALKMKPLPKQRWETVFDRRDI